MSTKNNDNFRHLKAHFWQWVT